MSKPVVNVRSVTATVNKAAVIDKECVSLESETAQKLGKKDNAHARAHAKGLKEAMKELGLTYGAGPVEAAIRKDKAERVVEREETEMTEKQKLHKLTQLVNKKKRLQDQVKEIAEEIKTLKADIG